MKRHNAVLVPLDWKRDSVPQLGASGQEIINRQLLDRADILFAAFRHRIGTGTAEDISGTAEEIRKAHESGKPVHVYFDRRPMPYDGDSKARDQYDKVLEFKRHLHGLYDEYEDIRDLRAKVWRAIEADLATLLVATPPPCEKTDIIAQVLEWGRPQPAEPNGFGFEGGELRNWKFALHNVGFTHAIDVSTNPSGLLITETDGVIRPESNVMEQVEIMSGPENPPPPLIVSWRDSDGSHRKIFNDFFQVLSRPSRIVLGRRTRAASATPPAASA